MSEKKKICIWTVERVPSALHGHVDNYNTSCGKHIYYEIMFHGPVYCHKCGGEIEKVGSSKVEEDSRKDASRYDEAGASSTRRPRTQRNILLKRSRSCYRLFVNYS